MCVYACVYMCVLDIHVDKDGLHNEKAVHFCSAYTYMYTNFNSTLPYTVITATKMIIYLESYLFV